MHAPLNHDPSNFTQIPANTLHLSLLNCTDTQIMLLTNAGPRKKCQYWIEQTPVCIELHLARTMHINVNKLK